MQNDQFQPNQFPNQTQPPVGPPQFTPPQNNGKQSRKGLIITIIVIVVILIAGGVAATMMLMNNNKTSDNSSKTSDTNSSNDTKNGTTNPTQNSSSQSSSGKKNSFGDTVDATYLTSAINSYTSKSSSNSNVAVELTESTVVVTVSTNSTPIMPSQLDAILVPVLNRTYGVADKITVIFREKGANLPLAAERRGYTSAVVGTPTDTSITFDSAKLRG